MLLLAKFMPHPIEEYAAIGKSEYLATLTKVFITEVDAKGHDASWLRRGEWVSALGSARVELLQGRRRSGLCDFQPSLSRHHLHHGSSCAQAQVRETSDSSVRLQVGGCYILITLTNHERDVQ